MPGRCLILGQIGIKMNLRGSSGYFSAEQIANMYACSSIIQFSWIIKLSFSIKADWVSCCSWDFLASYQTCGQNCSNSLSLILFPAIFQPVFLLYWVFSSWPSQLFGPEHNRKTGQDRVNPHHMHNPSRGMSNWFLLFERTGRAKAVLLLTHFCAFQRNKRQKPSSWVQTLEHLTECRH